MPAIHVRDIPEETVEALRRRAKLHHRSLQMELRHILSRAADEAPPATGFPQLNLKMSSAPGDATWRREDIYGDDER